MGEMREVALKQESEADGDTARARRLRIESIRILPPQHVTLTDEQKACAVAMLSELLMPLLKGRLLESPDSCKGLFHRRARCP